MQISHLQDDLCQIGALDFRQGKGFAALKSLLTVEPDAQTRPHATATAPALFATGLRNALHAQAGGSAFRVVARDAGQAGVDHIADAGNRDGRLGDIG